MLTVSALTGHFRSIIIFTIIILVHELGHFLTAYFLRWDIKRIDIYPYGGCSLFNNDINVPLWQETLVLIMGPLTQIIFIYSLKYFIDYSNLNIFKCYSNWILMFNLLPIYPLDVGKLVQLVLCKLLSYYHACKFTTYFSWFSFSIILLFSTFFYFQFILLFILIILGVTLFKEIKKMPFYYQRFLLERYTKEYNFSKIKKVDKPTQMKRDTIHIISNLPEKEYLTKYLRGYPMTI